MNFWDYSIWGFLNLFAILLLSLFVANMIKRNVKFLKNSLIPTSVLAGFLLLIVSSIFDYGFGIKIYSTKFFANVGTEGLEVLTYHALALGFIATTFTTVQKNKSKKRSAEIINTGVTTVSTYLLQGVLGLGITLIIGLVSDKICNYSGIILPFGYGQGTGQALNWGNIYETENGFVGGANFGLTIAALGFLSASIGGVVFLTINRKKFLNRQAFKESSLSSEQIQGSDEIPMNGSIDKMTFQIAFVLISYCIAYLIMFGISELIPSLKSLIFGFNFLFGVIVATIIKGVVNFLKSKNIIHRQYMNSFLMQRICGFFFDVMIVAGIASIQIELLKDYWWVVIILGIVGAVSTYYYNLFVAKKLFSEYENEQFLAMYGMLTGTASTGMVLLREIDGELKTPVAENLVFQNFPAIVLGFPIMILANLVPAQPYLVLIILFAMFVALNVLLFRSKIFKKKS